MKSGSGDIDIDDSSEDEMEEVDEEDEESISEIDEETTDTDDESQKDEQDAVELCKPTFRIPEELRTELNQAGYSNVRLELFNRRDDDNPQSHFQDITAVGLQTAAIQLLIDNPELWADKYEELADKYGELYEESD
jgi:hypothetical protein